MRMKSQWEIVTRNSRPPRFDPGHNRKPRTFDFTAMAKQAREAIDRSRAEREMGEDTYWVPKVIK